MIQFYHYLHYKDVVSLESCFQKPTPFVLYTILKTALLYPQGVLIDPSPRVLKEIKSIGFCYQECPGDPTAALDWLDKNEDYFCILEQYSNQENAAIYLMEDDRHFLQRQSLTPYQSLIDRFYSQEALPQMIHTCNQWRAHLHQPNPGDEWYQFLVGESLRWNLEGYPDKAFQILSEKVEELHQKKALFWHSVYWLVLAYLSWERGVSFLHKDALKQALRVFVLCKHRKLVIWGLTIWSLVLDDEAIMTEVMSFVDDCEGIRPLVFFFFYQKERVLFSDCMIECKNAENLRIAKKAVAIEIQRNGGNAEFVRRWNEILKEASPWLSYHKIL